MRVCKAWFTKLLGACALACAGCTVKVDMPPANVNVQMPPMPPVQVNVPPNDQPTHVHIEPRPRPWRPRPRS